MTDRISKAWQLRHDLHAYIRTNPGATVVMIFAAHHETCTETIRKALRRMRSDQEIEMDGSRGRSGTYRAITEAIQPEAETRKKLAMGATLSHVNRDEYATAHALRVRILAHMSGIERISGPDLAAAIGITGDHANRTCNAMCREGTMVRIGEGKSITYAVTGQPLITAEEMRARVYKLHSESGRDSTGAKPIGGPGSTVYRGGRLENTSWQGGQGSGMPRVFVGGGVE